MRSEVEFGNEITLAQNFIFRKLQTMIKIHFF